MSKSLMTENSSTPSKKTGEYSMDGKRHSTLCWFLRPELKQAKSAAQRKDYTWRKAAGKAKLLHLLRVRHRATHQIYIKSRLQGATKHRGLERESKIR